MTAAVDYAVYTLKGRSLEAAKTLYRLLEENHKAAPIDWNGKTIGEIRELSANFATKFHENLRKNHPDIIAALGINHQSVQVQSYRKGAPRAYATRPECHAGSIKHDQFFVYSHVDYQGNHFTPPDAVRQTEMEASHTNNLLWAGGWSNPITLVPAYKSGIALPADFNAKTSNTLTAYHLGDNPARPYRFFMAGGETLTTLQEQNTAKAVYAHRVNQLFESFQSLRAAMVKENAIEDISALNEFYFNMGLSTDAAGRPVLSVSARREGSGEPLKLLNNAIFDAHPHYNNDYIITPNPLSPFGQGLKGMMDAVPANPDLAAFPASLLNTDKVKPADKLDGAFGGLDKPLIRNFPEGIVLAYRVNGGKRDRFTPPGCREITQREFLWLEANQSDLNLGIRPPPSPQPSPQSSPAPKP